MFVLAFYTCIRRSALILFGIFMLCLYLDKTEIRCENSIITHIKFVVKTTILTWKLNQKNTLTLEQLVLHTGGLVFFQVV